ncbi:unnamed protein product [Phytophthora fragariaefolia]|uniref:Unnamed protein product n=1 Tax=Phytophthora fragariaefolia TaxID=1490495 RepID=A0A9W7D224_9STRA|nr:unnamed protein product [Phytophthora fragariaefolia]
MAERNVKFDFGKRELKFHNDYDEKVIVSFQCHGVHVTPLLEAPGEWVATVRLAKTVKLTTNTRSVVQGVKKEDADPLTNEDSLAIGEMEPTDRDIVIALLRQHAGIVEKKEGCPPLAKAPVEHHINTGGAAPILLRRRIHAVSENKIIDDNVNDMLKE